MEGHHQQVGDAVAGFARGALERGTAGDHPDIAYSWYVNFLEWIRDTGHTVLGPTVAVGEVVIGIALILGLFTGIMAFLSQGRGVLRISERPTSQRSRPGADAGRRSPTSAPQGPRPLAGTATRLS